MDIQRAIELLKQKSQEAIYVASLNYNNNEYIPWRRNIEDILEAAFGVNSTEYKRIANRQPSLTKGTSAQWQRAYKDLVHRIQLEINSIIQKYQILGIETKPAKKTEQKDTVKLPIQLFDAMQFHKKVIQASRALFEDEHYAQAIFEAFKAVNNFAKEKSGLQQNEIRGMKDSKLMAKIFDVKNPIIKVNQLLSDSDISEQEGFKFLFMGATVGIRNPKAHDFIEMKDPHKTLEYLAFASLLLKKISFWKVD